MTPSGSEPQIDARNGLSRLTGLVIVVNLTEKLAPSHEPRGAGASIRDADETRHASRDPGIYTGHGSTRDARGFRSIVPDGRRLHQRD